MFYVKICKEMEKNGKNVVPLLSHLFIYAKMAAFIGEYISKLDDRGRLIFPSELRAQASGTGISYVVRKNVFNASLEMYTMEEWDKLSAQVKSRINIFSREGNKVWEGFNRDRAIVTPDEKMARIMIPKNLLEKINVQKEVVFVGQDFKIQLWAKENWVANEIPEEEFANLFEKLLGQ
jgi:MraZ protein